MLCAGSALAQKPAIPVSATPYVKVRVIPNTVPQTSGQVFADTLGRLYWKDFTGRIVRLDDTVATVVQKAIFTGSTAHITSPGINTVSFTSVGTSNYMPIVKLIGSGGSDVTVVPQIAPLTDSRTATQFQVACADTGILWWSLILH